MTTIGEWMTLDKVEGGVSAPLGFRAAGVACGIKRDRLDLALLVADRPASAAGVFTTNRVQAAPVLVSRSHLERSRGVASAVIVNSGCANACTGEDGLTVARETTRTVAQALGCPVEQVLVASTGVIGVGLDLHKIKQGVPMAISQLTREGHAAAAKAIMTTDPAPKEAAARIDIAGGTFSIGGMAKGAGMIEPNMATMLAFVTTDAQVPSALLQRALNEAVDESFNAITVDGDCSTNDTVIALASGASPVRIDEAAYGAFVNGLQSVCRELALAIVRGGEGATKLVRVEVVGAGSQDDARRAARTIANSLLVKTAIHGGDPNWGRLLSAAGRSGADLHLAGAAVSIGSSVLFSDGRPHDELAPIAAEYLQQRDIDIRVDLGTGGGHRATVWTCDLSADYVRINAEYRT